jgi:hypothetical protein
MLLAMSLTPSVFDRRSIGKPRLPLFSANMGRRKALVQCLMSFSVDSEAITDHRRRSVNNCRTVSP